MKPSRMKLLNRFRAITFIFLIVSSVQCSKYLGETEEYTVNSPAAGSQVVPLSSSTATGALTGVYKSGKNMLIGTISWAGLSGAPTGIHIHGPAKAGAARLDEAPYYAVWISGCSDRFYSNRITIHSITGRIYESADGIF